jgi:hypothetical protein
MVDSVVLGDGLIPLGDGLAEAVDAADATELGAAGDALVADEQAAKMAVATTARPMGRRPVIGPLSPGGGYQALR